MYEYALVDHIKDFVLCRVFVKSHRGNSISDNVLSSGAEESYSAVRHIGIQHDGAVTPDIGEAKAHDDNSLDGKNETLRFPMTLVSELDDQVTIRPVSAAGCQFPSGIHSNELVRSSGLTHGGAVFADSATAEFLSILEGDFIELNDLIGPLSGIDDLG
ncbi:hypothetical protein L1049_026151 [Liquidambar formosana]|uniref:Uncharacterized protein n=1 Tax=Liquidambar formosana TaxID=63359 RepID=A0AAP0R663_LIQFO